MNIAMDHGSARVGSEDAFARKLETITQAFAQTAADYDRDGSFPFENFARLHREGLIALTVPAEFGGGGAGLGRARQVIEAVARGEPSTALVLTMQYGFQRRIASHDAIPAELKARIARDAVENGGVMNALGVEPELGSPIRGGLLSTVAKKTSAGWSISGHKIYSTGIPVLTWLLVVARIDDGGEPRNGMFLVPRETPGISIVETWNHMGMRATGSHDVLLEDVVVPLDHMFPMMKRDGESPQYDAEEAAWGMTMLSSIYDAVARSARDWLLRFLNNRKPSGLGAALATLPRFQEAVGDIDSLLLLNRALFDQMIALVDGGTAPPIERSMTVKHLVTKNAIDVVERAIALTGNPGLSRSNPIERHYRDVLCSRIHSPQSDIILQRVGKIALDDCAASMAS